MNDAVAKDTTNWSATSVSDAVRELGTSMDGLTAADVTSSRVRSGSNRIPLQAQRSPVLTFLEQFQSPLILILFVAAAISFAFHEVRDGWIIVGVVLFNGVIGFIQEGRASAAMNQLASLSPQIVYVIRDHHTAEIAADEVVVGDIVILETGSTIPADGRLIEAINIKVTESAFTGESVPVEKHVEAVSSTARETEQSNMGWRATTVVSGRGKLVVTAVGRKTRFGAIVEEVAHINPESTPFQQSISQFAKRLGFVIVGLSAGVFVIAVLRGFGVEQSLLLSISLIVSLVPEGLPVVMTLTFAWGMWRMARRHALVRKLIAVETLGSVTVIATDKTGTLTFGEMMVEEALIGNELLRVTGQGYKPIGEVSGPGGPIKLTGHDALRRLVEVGALNNDSRLVYGSDGQSHWVGDPTEISLTVLGEKTGVHRADLDSAYPRVGEFPFDFTLKYMVTFHETPRPGTYLIAVKGAPRQVLAMCEKQLTLDGVVPMHEADREKVRLAFEQMAERSLRGLCVAYAETSTDWRSVQHEHLKEHLVYVGLVGIRDAIRPEASSTVAIAHRAGIRVMMLTGDYRKTAETIARELGILRPHGGSVIDGQELDAWTDDEVLRRLPQVEVFSRVTPEQKLRIARLLKQQGEIVAMTGDGVNDVPALTEATIGVAIGANSSDAAKEAAEMIVTDGDLTSIVAAVEEGRTMFRNIQRVLLFVLASNLGELVLILLAMFLGLPLPLLPVHIIWLNVITDPFLGIALAREPKSPYVMQERPRSPRAPILTVGQWWRILLDGSAIAVGSLGVFLIGMAGTRSAEEVFAMTLTSVAIGEWLSALTSRSSRRTMLSKINQSPLILMALGVVVLMQLAILYLPSLATTFHVAPLTPADWIVIVPCSLLIVVVEEVRKYFTRRTRKSL